MAKNTGETIIQPAVEQAPSLPQKPEANVEARLAAFGEQYQVLQKELTEKSKQLHRFTGQASDPAWIGEISQMLAAQKEIATLSGSPAQEGIGNLLAAAMTEETLKNAKAASEAYQQAEKLFSAATAAQGLFTQFLEKAKKNLPDAARMDRATNSALQMDKAMDTISALLRKAELQQRLTNENIRAVQERVATQLADPLKRQPKQVIEQTKQKPYFQNLILPAIEKFIAQESAKNASFNPEVLRGYLLEAISTPGVEKASDSETPQITVTEELVDTRSPERKATEEMLQQHAKQVMELLQSAYQPNEKLREQQLVQEGLLERLRAVIAADFQADFSKVPGATEAMSSVGASETQLEGELKEIEGILDGVKLRTQQVQEQIPTMDESAMKKALEQLRDEEKRIEEAKFKGRVSAFTVPEFERQIETLRGVLHEVYQKQVQQDGLEKVKTALLGNVQNMYLGPEEKEQFGYRLITGLSNILE